MFTTLSSQTTNAVPRTDFLEGREHWVVPTVMLTEGVHAGSQGPIYYPESELVKNMTGWNHKPVVVYHPMIGGKSVSACDPVVLTNSKIGIVLNTVYNGKLSTEAWLDKERTVQIDSRIAQNIMTGKITEISTGLHLDAEEAAGEFKGTKYTHVGRNYRPDHLAVLPDQIGACSVAKGAGLLVNSSAFSLGMKVHPDLERSLKSFVYDRLNKEAQFTNNEFSFSQIRGQLNMALSAKFGEKGQYWDGYIDEIYSDYVIFHDHGCWKIEYKATDSGVTLEGDAVAVSAVIQYVPVSGGKAASTDTEVENTTMNKQALINDILAANATMFPKATLEAMTEEALTTIKAGLVKPAPVVANTTPAPAPVVVPAPKPMTVEEFIANAPPSIASFLQDSIAVQADTRTALIANIMKCPANKFPEEVLKNKTTSELKMLEEFAKAITTASEAPVANTGNYGFVNPGAVYIGATGATPVSVINSKPPEPMQTPELFPAK